MDNSVPEILKLKLSPSGSLAVTIPIAVWFSAALKVASEVKTGAASFISIIVIVIFLVTVSVPSVNVNVIEYELLVS